MDSPTHMSLSTIVRKPTKSKVQLTDDEDVDGDEEADEEMANAGGHTTGVGSSSTQSFNFAAMEECLTAQMNENHLACMTSMTAHHNATLEQLENFWKEMCHGPT